MILFDFMDGRKNNGGNKNAGRKPKIEEIALIEKLGPLEESAFKALSNGLDEGDFPFVKLYFSYRFGNPKDSLDVTSNGDGIKSISPIEWVKDAEDKE
jgi:hypothetical protein